jgi:hypothetical protein
MGFGYLLLQQGNDDASIQAAQDYWDGKAFLFMTKESSAMLHPVCFGAWKCRGNKVRLHSHLGKCFAGDYAINKMQHYIFGQRFVWVTDCYAVKFLLSYEGGNPAILLDVPHVLGCGYCPPPRFRVGRCGLMVLFGRRHRLQSFVP